MSQRKQFHDKVSAKDSVAALKTDHNDSHNRELSTGGWRRRSLFSSERLDLILANLRRDLCKSVDGSECKQLCDAVSYSSDAPRHLHHQHQQQSGAADVKDRCSRQKLLPLNRHFSTENSNNACGDVQSDDKSVTPAELTQNVAESSHCYADDTRCDANHRDVAQSSADSVQGNPSGGCRIKKSVSFRAEPKLLSCNAEGDKHVISRMCRTAPRPQNNQRQQQLNQPVSKVASLSSLQPFHNTTPLDGDRPSVKTVIRDQNKNQETGSKQALSKGATKRSISSSGQKTREGTNVDEQLLSCNGSWSSSERQQCPASDCHQRHPTSINWYVDVTDSANTEFRPNAPLASGTADRSRQYPCDYRTGTGSKSISVAVNDGYKLEPESFRRRAWSQSSGGRERATTRLTSDQLWQPTHTHHDATATAYTSSTTSSLAELGKTAAPLQRTWSTKAAGTSERRTDRNPDSNDQARPSISSQFRRSMVATRPRYTDTGAFIDAESVVQPAEHTRKSKRIRSISLSERYRMLVNGDWIDKFAASPTDTSQQKLTPINGLHKPLALPRELKPDFVIYV